jgi:CHASE2 domain-containing sensor protein
MEFHQLLSYLDFREISVDRVALVEIDDKSFYHPPFSGIQPTNRRAIADLAKTAAESGALVVAIDFQLKSPFAYPGDDDVRSLDNRYLLDTLGNVAKSGTPVVITCGFVRKGRSEWIRDPNIVDDGMLPPGVAVGYINIPVDSREIPLEETAWNWDGGPKTSFDSFALQIVSSYEGVKRIYPATKQKKAIVGALKHHEFVYGGFLKNSAFSHSLISTQDLLAGSDEARKLCRGRIVMIGGDWHQYGENRGPPIEKFRSPVGDIPGLFLHANYVEALLDNNFRPAVPAWFGVTFDLVVGILLYICFHAVKRVVGRIGVLVVFSVPAWATYFLFANLGRYLDFVLPLSLCFIHLAYQLVENYIRMRRGPKIHASAV